MVWIATGLVVNQLMALKLTMGSWWCRYFWYISLSLSIVMKCIWFSTQGTMNLCSVADPWYSFGFVKMDTFTLLTHPSLRLQSHSVCNYYIHVTTVKNPLLYLVRPTFCSMTIVHFEKSFKTICMGHCLVFVCVIGRNRFRYSLGNRECCKNTAVF